VELVVFRVVAVVVGISAVVVVQVV